MHAFPLRRIVLGTLAAASTALVLGCGNTRTSNTMRTATEQLLISDAIDRTVESIDFSPLAGQTVFFDESRLVEVVDKGYLISSLRQHMLASGCILKDARDQATFVVEPRAGVVGTDNHDLLFGVPALQLPQVPVAAAIPAAIPEIPFAKRRDQSGIAKVAVFAYRRETGEPVWQSGIVINKSTANDIWVLGAGPFQRGTIYDSAQFAGKELGVEGDDEEFAERNRRVAGVHDEAIFAGLNPAPPPAKPSDPPPAAAPNDAVQQASATEPAAPVAAASDGVQQASAAEPVAPERTSAAATESALESAPVAMGPAVPPPRPISEAPSS
jgi:hypothetical protein